MTNETNCNEIMAKINTQLQQQHIRERRAAVETLFALMLEGDCMLEGIGVLQAVAKSNDFLIIQDLAKEKLANPQLRQLADLDVKPGDEQHIFQTTCPDGHVNYYDKRKVCGPNSDAIFFDIGEKDRLRLDCKEKGCGKFFIVKVDCGDYR